MKKYIIPLVAGLLAISSFYVSDIIPMRKNQNKTVEGFDTNDNGIRDEIDYFINENFSEDSEKRLAVIQAAKALQKPLNMKDEKNKDIEAMDFNISKAIFCLSDIYGDLFIAGSIMDQLQEITMNTLERKDVYKNFNESAAVIRSARSNAFIIHKDSCENK